MAWAGRQGYATIVDPDQPLWERDTVQCVHCSAVIYVKPHTFNSVFLILHRDGRWTEEPGCGCSLCHGPVCIPCYKKGTCTPLEKWLEEMERQS